MILKAIFIIEKYDDVIVIRLIMFSYRQFLIQADVLSVERCNDILKEKKYPPLFNGKNSG